MPTPLSALLVMPSGAARRGARTALERAGFVVRTAPEPYAATLALAEAPADLLVLDLAAFRRRDGAFLRALRRRSPTTRVLLLLPEGARRAALHALEQGADAYVLDPFRAEELCAVARGLLRERLEPQAADPAALRRLADEVAHAVNNPLQVLSLGLEAGAAGRGAADAGLREPVGRIRDVVALLSAYGRLPAPVRAPLDLGPLLRGVLEAATKAGQVRVSGPLPAEGARVLADAGQVKQALESVLAALAGRAAALPLALSARTRPPDRRRGGAGVQLRLHGLVLPPADLEALPASVLTSHEQTRRALPGLALAAAVARAHGGRLALQAGRAGLVVTLRLGG